jgi:8-oxo-dGTP diphosphatase
MPVSDQGINRQRYQVIPRTLIFLTSEDKILLLKGAPHKKIWANKFNGIGGHIEQGEDIYSAAQRELSEESGLSQVVLWLCGVVTVDTDTQPGICLFVFKGQTPNTQVSPSKEGELCWFSPNELQHLPLVEDLPAIIPRILERQPRDPPFFAKYSYNKEGKLEIVFVDPTYPGI